MKPVARHIVTIISPEGRTKSHKAFRVYVSENRVTWIAMDGVRSYVLLRHGFDYIVKNA